MEYLINQLRRRNPGQMDLQKNGERKISPQKTTSYEGEKRRSRSWLQRQFSQENGGGSDSNEIERAAAVAAAAYVITSLEEEPSISLREKITKGQPEPSLTRLKSKREGKKAVSIVEPGEGSSRSQGSLTSGNMPDIVPMDDEGIPTKAVNQAPTLKNTPLISPHRDGQRTVHREANVPAKGSSDYVPSIRKTPTFQKEPDLPMKSIPTSGEPQLNAIEETRRPERVIAPETHLVTTMTETGLPKPVPPTTIEPAREVEMPKVDLPPLTTMKRQSSTVKPGNGNSKADDWERHKMAKINKKYEELNNRIVSWEDKKKAKARRQLDNTESEMERMRLKSMKKFKREMDDINQIAGGAKAKAAEKKRDEEVKVKEKGIKIRSTGKVPRPCSCF